MRLRKRKILPRIVEDGAPTDGLCTRAALVTDEVGVVAVKEAIIFNVQRELVRERICSETDSRTEVSV